MANKNFKTDITADGDISGKNLKATNSAVNEGGQIELSTPSSGTTLSGTNVTIDVYQDKLRFFESGGTNRGAYIPLPSTGSAVGTNLLGGTTGAMNYAQAAATKQSGISSSGVTIVSQSFTTNGYPVQVIVTGDAENSTAGGWVIVQLHRDSTAIGKKVHIEMSAASENVPYALTVIDDPAAGTYTYSLKTVSTVAAGTMNFGETDGPVLTLVELSGPKGDTGAAGATGDSFKTIAVTGQDSVVADSSTDTLNLVAGTNVSITTDATTDSITINSTGAYTSVDSITYPDYITFDTTPETVPTAAGSLYWDSGDGLPATVLNANVSIGLGQEQVALVKNATGASIAKGKVVYINGAQGQRPTITLSDADSETTSSKTFGVTAEAIADGAEGFVTTFGVLRGVNTDGLTQGAALWLSSTAGGYSTSIPAEPAHSVFIGYVVKAHASSGEIFVNIQNGYELNELHGVLIDGTPADNEVLAYDTTSGLWINQTAAEAGLAALAGAVFTGDVELDVTRKLIFDGATDEAYKTSLYIVDPTNDRNILLPDASGTLALTGDISTIVGDYIPLTQKGAAQGVAELDIDTLVPVEQIPDLSATYLTPTAADLDYQPLDADLTAIAALTANGILRKTSGTWGMDSATYLTSYTETDPVFVAHPAYGITSTKIGNWDSAYGWGDHALAGYASSSHNHSLDSLSNVVITGTPSDGQAIVWDTTTSKWVNETVTQDLSAYAPLAGATFTGDVVIATKEKFSNTGTGTPTFSTYSSGTRSILYDNVGATSVGYTLGIAPGVLWQTIPGADSGQFFKWYGGETELASLSGSGNAIFTGDVAVNGGDITTTSTTAKLYHSNATTIEIGHAATTLSIGDIGHSGTTTINNNLEVYGSITFSQGASSLSATTIQIDDTLISLADNNTADILDIGFFAGYRQSSTDYHTGLVRDASDSGIWKLFAGVTAQPTGTVDFTSATYGTLKIGALEVTDASTTRTNLGLAIGTNVQAYNSTLAAVAGGTYTGDDSITTVGTISSGTWSGTAIGYTKGGTGLTSLGTAGQVLTVNSGATGLEWGTASGGGPSTTSTLIDTNSVTAIESFAIATSRTAEAIIQVTQGTDYYCSKVLLIHDGTNVKITEYAILESTVGAIPLTISAAISGSDLELLATITDAATTNATAKVVLIEVAI